MPTTEQLIKCPDCTNGETKETCLVCDGTGCEDCPRCGGVGSVYINRDPYEKPCPHCGGGKVANYCRNCASSGHHLERCETCGGIGKMPAYQAFALVEQRKKEQEKKKKQQEAEQKRQAEERAKQEVERKAKEAEAAQVLGGSSDSRSGRA